GPRDDRSGGQRRGTGEQDNRPAGQAGQEPGNVADVIHGDLPGPRPDGQQAGAARGGPTGLPSYPSQSPSPCGSRIPLARYGASTAGAKPSAALAGYAPASPQRRAHRAPRTPAQDRAASLPGRRLPAHPSAAAELTL